MAVGAPIRVLEAQPLWFFQDVMPRMIEDSLEAQGARLRRSRSARSGHKQIGTKDFEVGDRGPGTKSKRVRLDCPQLTPPTKKHRSLP